MNEINETYFWSKIDIRGPDECWPCKCWRLKGYGQIRFGNRNLRTHRLAWEFHNKKEAPKEMLVCHKCDNPPCCNPKHLYLGTSMQNVEDKINRNRMPNLKGEKNGRAKLTESDVIEIKNQLILGDSCLEISNKFNVKSGHIRAIRNGHRWPHIKI